jgi:hypothetical protein
VLLLEDQTFLGHQLDHRIVVDCQEIDIFAFFLRVEGDSKQLTCSIQIFLANWIVFRHVEREDRHGGVVVVAVDEWLGFVARLW